MAAACTSFVVGRIPAVQAQLMQSMKRFPSTRARSGNSNQRSNKSSGDRPFPRPVATPPKKLKTKTLYALTVIQTDHPLSFSLSHYSLQIGRHERSHLRSHWVSFLEAHCWMRPAPGTLGSPLDPKPAFEGRPVPLTLPQCEADSLLTRSTAKLGEYTRTLLQFKTAKCRSSAKRGGFFPTRVTLAQLPARCA